MKKLKKAIANKPKSAQLDVIVDGETIGHMTLSPGG